MNTLSYACEEGYHDALTLSLLCSTLRGVVLKYNEPPEARKPVRNWRLYVFKGKEQVGASLRFSFYEEARKQG